MPFPLPSLSNKVFDLLNAGLVIIDENYKVLFWNKWMCNHSQKQPGEIIGNSLLDVYPELDGTRIISGIEQAIDKGFPTVISHLFNKNPIPLFHHNQQDKTDQINHTVDISPLTIENNRFCIIQINDVTASVKREKALENLIHERKEIEVELRKSIVKAEYAVKAKSDFLATMSHEIRTPMNGILGMAQLLTLTDLSDTQKEYIQVINKSSLSLLHIINDILDFSKIEAHKMTLTSQAFSLKETIVDILELIKPEAEKKQITTCLDVDSSLPDNFVGDAIRIRQILLNFINNAVKFTEAGTITVRIEGELVDNNTTAALEISVSDTGLGISKKEQTELFEPFTQVDSSSTRKHGGTGLGLAICKKLVELMHGRIGVSSCLGEGSTFWIKLNLPFVHEDQLLEENHSNNAEKQSYEGSVLLVEDNHDNQVLVQIILSEIGLETTIASNGKDAVELCKQHEYDLILMDCQMPVMDGYDATRAIRKLDKMAGVPIIALTANIQESDKLLCYESGMNDYLSKPFVLKDLMAKINQWL